MCEFFWTRFDSGGSKMWMATSLATIKQQQKASREELLLTLTLIPNHQPSNCTTPQLPVPPTSTNLLYFYCIVFWDGFIVYFIYFFILFYFWRYCYVNFELNKVTLYPIPILGSKELVHLSTTRMGSALVLLNLGSVISFPREANYYYFLNIGTSDWLDLILATYSMYK